MAPPRLYSLPHEQLVELLSAYRAAGLAFEEAWQLAVRPHKPVVMTTTRVLPDAACVRWPTDSSDRMAWQAAIHSSKDEFRRAYQRRPATRREQAAGLLVMLLLAASDERARARGIGRGAAVRSAA